MTGLMDSACVHVSVSLCCINVQTLLSHLQFSYAELNIQGRTVNAGSEFRKGAAC